MKNESSRTLLVGNTTTVLVVVVISFLMLVCVGADSTPTALYYPAADLPQPAPDPECIARRPHAEHVNSLRITVSFIRASYMTFKRIAQSVPICPVPNIGTPECVESLTLESLPAQVADLAFIFAAGICNSYTAPKNYLGSTTDNLIASVNMWSQYRKINMHRHLSVDIKENSALLGYQVAMTSVREYITPYHLVISDIEKGNPSGTSQLPSDVGISGGVYATQKSFAKSSYPTLLHIYSSLYSKRTA